MDRRDSGPSALLATATHGHPIRTGCINQRRQTKIKYLLWWRGRGWISASRTRYALHHMNRVRSRHAKRPSDKKIAFNPFLSMTVTTATHDWILYVDNASSSFKTLPIAIEQPGILQYRSQANRNYHEERLKAQ